MLLDIDSFYIEPIQTVDAWGICNFVIANEDRLKRYFPKTLRENLTPDLSKIFANKKAKQFSLKEEFLFVIKEKVSKAIAGLIYIKDLNNHKKQGEFAYCIGYPFEGQGVTTRSVNALSDYAFNNLNLNTLKIIVHKDNKASIRVAENCNFTWKKTLKNEFTPTGESAIDMELYELYNEIET